MASRFNFPRDCAQCGGAFTARNASCLYCSTACALFSKASPEPNSGCWLWDGATNNAGYGNFWNGRAYVSAHCESYREHVGPIPDGLEIDHVCRTRACVNPAHLEPVTRLENVRRGASGPGKRVGVHLKTHCPQGHVYSEVNEKGAYFCRICTNKRKREAARRKYGYQPRTAP